MLSILNRALSWAITSFGNKFCLKKRSRLIKASDNRFHVKFMQIEIGLLYHRDVQSELKVGIFARRAMVDQARERLCYQRET